jgi:hypothetical protein
MINENNNAPLSTQGDAGEKEEQLGGSTNLSIEQLKEEGDTNDPSPDLQPDDSGLDNTNTENEDLIGAP